MLQAWVQMLQAWVQMLQAWVQMLQAWTPTLRWEWAERDEKDGKHIKGASEVGEKARLIDGARNIKYYGFAFNSILFTVKYYGFA
jgi:hypothetical protein